MVECLFIKEMTLTAPSTTVVLRLYLKVVAIRILGILMRTRGEPDTRNTICTCSRRVRELQLLQSMQAGGRWPVVAAPADRQQIC